VEALLVSRVDLLTTLFAPAEFSIFCAIPISYSGQCFRFLFAVCR
jgi:hypothetical protein